jgi:hypothetical protein
LWCLLTGRKVDFESINESSNLSTTILGSKKKISRKENLKKDEYGCLEILLRDVTEQKYRPEVSSVPVIVSQQRRTRVQKNSKIKKTK